MKKALDILSNVLQTISGILFLFIFLINVAGIICRTFLDFSLLWVADGQKSNGDRSDSHCDRFPY